MVTLWPLTEVKGCFLRNLFRQLLFGSTAHWPFVFLEHVENGSSLCLVDVYFADKVSRADDPIAPCSTILPLDLLEASPSVVHH